MLFSAKITNSIINYLEDKGYQLDSLYDCIDVQIELLKDPNYWLDAYEVERFLSKTEELFRTSLVNEDLISEAGHHCFSLKSWGVLDSVLKMMQRPQDIYEQPARIISYFVSPAPPIGKFSKNASKISFELPIFSQEFPYVTAYLKSALEALPMYVGKSMSQVTWTGSVVEIKYIDYQNQLFDNVNEKNNISPELFQSMITTLEQSHLELQKKNEEILLKEQEIKILKSNLDNVTKATSGKVFDDQASKDFNNIKSEVLRLNDYLARAQQLITMLVGQGRRDVQVQKAMKRVNWEGVMVNWQSTLRDILGQLDKKKQEEENRLITKTNSKQFSENIKH